jgi:hypothetical protein
MTVQQDDNGEPVPLEVTDIKELMPADWRGVPVSVSSYRAFRLRPEELSQPKLFDLLGVRVHLNWGAAPYFKSRLWMEPQINGDIHVFLERQGFQHAPPGPFVMLMAKTERDTSSRLRSVVALLRLALGRNIAVEPLGDLEYTASIPNATAAERPFRPPTFDPAPNVADESLRLISELQTALDALDEELRNRVELSLQWYFRASSEIQGIDGFLMYWFALDVLAMPRSAGRFAALERRLAEIYEVDLPGVRAKFRLSGCSVYGTTLSMKDINRRSISTPSTTWAQSIGFDSLHGRLLARFSKSTTSTTGSPSLDRENLGRVLGVASSSHDLARIFVPLPLRLIDLGADSALAG